MESYFFFDTSAIVKRYMPEIGNAWVQTVTNPANGHNIAISEITLVETAAAFSAKQRAPGGISLPRRARVLALFLGHCEVEYTLIAVTRPVLDRAIRLTQDHKLRGCDAIQLATALVANESLVSHGLAALTFVAADDALLQSAQAAGLSTINPNTLAV